MPAQHSEAPGRPEGLTGTEARRLLEQVGPNALPSVRPTPRWRKFTAQFTHFFALLLWGAAILAFVAAMPQLGWAVVVVVAVNGTFSFFQEERAARAAARLRDLLPSDVTVVRDGLAVRVPTAGVVPGDVALLAAGDRIPADIEFLEADNCTADESMLTGESEPVPKQPPDRGFGGTFIANGSARGLVTATGAGTRLAAIAVLTTQTSSPPSPLQRELKRIVRTLSGVALGCGGAFCIISLLVGLPLRDALLFAIGVAVALIPEGLLPTVTLSLAVGAQRMAKHNALVRNLQAVETLGSTTFICTDKTGTLTQNRMSAVEIWTASGRVAVAGSGYEPRASAVSGEGQAVRDAERVAWAARTASRGRIRFRAGEWTADGDPMEAALDALAHRLAGPEGPAEAVPGARNAFDAARRRESVVVDGVLLLKGAPESVLPLCAEGKQAEAAARAVEEMASRGLRVLAVADRSLGEAGAAASTEELERGLRLLGLVGLHDPPRETVPQALRQAREAGIKVAMVTGDHPATALAIARETGLSLGNPRVVEGRDLPDDDHMLGALLDYDGVVVSRVTPEQKLRVAKSLQARGHVLAMTGDGVNDGPALNEADIGIAMGAAGTDVAREAADLVLLDDDFATIISAVEQGRATYSNIRRFLTYHLTDNVSELTPFVVWALSGGNFPLALGVLQILCLDIGTDLLPALALGAERPGQKILKEAPEKRHLMDRAVMFRVFAVLGPVQAVCEMGAFTVVLGLSGWRPGDLDLDPAALAAASGAAFATVVLAQMANAFGCRSEHLPAWRLSWNGNRLLLWAVVVELLLLLAFLFVGPVAQALGQAPPPAQGWVAALLAMPAVLVVDALHKHFTTGPD